jgi:hypothetical protein
MQLRTRPGSIATIALVALSAGALSGCASFPKQAEYEEQIEQAEAGKLGSLENWMSEAKKNGSGQTPELVSLKQNAFERIKESRLRSDAIKLVLLRELSQERSDRDKVMYLEKQLEESYRKKLQIMEEVTDQMKFLKGISEPTRANIMGTFFMMSL